MKSLHYGISLMSQSLEELVDTAKKLRDFSLQVGSEEELASLQNKQSHLLRELEVIDQDLHANYPGQIDPTTHDLFHQKLQEFQKYNHEYIENLKQRHGLIQFELKYLAHETHGEIPTLSVLHKPKKENSELK
jgi:hypothetical protein